MLQLAVVIAYNLEEFRIIQGHVKHRDVQLVDVEEDIISYYTSLRSQNEMKRTLVTLWACVYKQAKSVANCKCKIDTWR